MNYKLILNILSSVNGGLITGAALFNPLIGQDHSLQLISVLGICQIVVSAVNSNLSTQANTVSSIDPGTLVKTVAALTGDDGKPAVRVNVNANAGASVAAVAVDPTQPNVGAATPDARAALINKAAS